MHTFVLLDQFPCLFVTTTLPVYNSSHHVAAFRIEEDIQAAVRFEGYNRVKGTKLSCNSLDLILMIVPMKSLGLRKITSTERRMLGS